MKKTYIVIIVLILIVLGFLFFIGKGSKLEAPAPTDNSQVGMVNQGESQNTTAQDNTSVTGQPIIDNRGVKEFIISGQNYSFSPNVITVNKGDKVRIIFKNTAGFHDFKIDEFNIATKQMQAPYQEIVEFTADKTGSFQYYCSVGSHRSMGMFGTLNVE